VGAILYGSMDFDTALVFLLKTQQTSAARQACPLLKTAFYPRQKQPAELLISQCYPKRPKLTRKGLDIIIGTALNLHYQMSKKCKAPNFRCLVVAP
jgi:hypothetical protein